jgi:hypothetical protein
MAPSRRSSGKNGSVASRRAPPRSRHGSDVSGAIHDGSEYLSAVRKATPTMPAVIVDGVPE